MFDIKTDLTIGSVPSVLVRFSLPYMLACFLQTFYGLADLFVIGLSNGSDSITAVAVGSQVMHLVTLVIVGLAMGPTVLVGRAVGAGERRIVGAVAGSTVTIFTIIGAILTAALLFNVENVLSLLSAPDEAIDETRRYLMICFAGIPFVTAYNVICSIFRGMGDSRSPMWFVASAGVFNIILDWILIGIFGMGAAGAAFATVVSQLGSVVVAVVAMLRMKIGPSIRIGDLIPTRDLVKQMFKIGLPIALQELCIQISFIVITVIANRRGVEIAAAVGIVEKIISFLFLVPSAMLSSVSAVASQNAGAALHARGREALIWGSAITFVSGLIFAVLCEFWAEEFVGAFAGDEENVIRMGAQYLRTYVFDCAIAGVHFCYSGYFCAYQMSMIPFVHNIASSVLVRIPGAYLTSIYFSDSLWQMGAAAPAGSLFSISICAVAYSYFNARGAFK